MGNKKNLDALDKAHLKIHRLENIISKMGDIVKECMEYTQEVEKEHMPEKFRSRQTIHEDEIDPFINETV